VTTESEWTKSSRSGTEGDCVEVTSWTKSSRSSPSGECVEVGVLELGEGFGQE
jgi:Domain of unknown function (DUF397)